MSREEFCQKMVLAMAARPMPFDYDTAVCQAINAFNVIKANVLKNSAEFTSVSGRAALRANERKENEN
ncbi:hypothetical protein F9K85_09610 [Brucella tritici]|uniref:hypothetical protein n=1 Tax=Brucella tritici TaxID=94626 RepID=UPI00124F25B2|nr:hypothetical protein [Brucella tritici]KAB2676742.1 hypothetical protein F9K85_09610 [Brucella tritici]